MNKEHFIRYAFDCDSVAHKNIALRKAADEIERVWAENARLREALEQIASGGLFQHAHEFARASLVEKGEK